MTSYKDIINNINGAIASKTIFTPDGDLTSTNLQDAVVELRNDTDIKIASIVKGSEIKGSYDVGGGLTFANFPTSLKKGEIWYIINANNQGTILGTTNTIEVNNKDNLIALVDNPSITDGADWLMIDNTDAVSSVFGRKGAISAMSGDYTANYISNIPAGNIQSNTVQEAINELDAEKEPVFSKNTAFNKNFGTIAGTVAQGNDARIVDSFQKSTDNLDNIAEGTTNKHFTNAQKTDLTNVKNGKNVKTWFISGGANGSGSDSNNGYKPDNAFLTINKLNSSMGNTGEQAVFLPSQLTENGTFNQLNAEFVGFSASHRAICGTSGLITSNNGNAGSQTYAFLNFGSFAKTGSGYTVLYDVTTNTSFSDNSNGTLDSWNCQFDSITPISITGSGIKNFYNQRGGVFNINNANAKVNVVTNDYIVQFTLTAGLLSITNAIIYIQQGAIFTIGASATTFIGEGVRFLYPDNTLARINIPAGSYYSLQGGCVFDRVNSTLNGIDISSNYQGYFGSLATKILNLTSLTSSAILATDTNKNVQSLSVATYPSLVELSYIKGLTSSIQTQLNSKENVIGAGNIYQYYRGDKTFQNLDKTTVGLGNVVNVDTSITTNITDTAIKRFTSDTEKNIWNSKQAGNTILNLLSSLELSGQSGKAIIVTETENGFTFGTAGGGGGGASSLNDLTDVDIATAQNSQVLLYINGKWENKPITECTDLFDGSGKIPLNKVSISTINIKGLWNASTNVTYPKNGGANGTLTSGGAIDGDVWIVQTAGNTVLDGYSSWQVNDWVYGNGNTWSKLSSSSNVVSVQNKTGLVVLNPNDLNLTQNTPVLGSVNIGDGIQTAILKLLNSINNISISNKPPLSFVLNKTDITITGAGTSTSITWTAQTNAVRYKVFAKQASLGEINIVSDTPIAITTPPVNYANTTVLQGIQYNYTVVCDITVDNINNVQSYTTQTSIPNFILDTFDLSTGTTASATWSSVIGASEYKIFYQQGLSLTSPTIISGITGTSRIITGLTTSLINDVNTAYTFKVEAYNSSGIKIAETTTMTRPIFPRINIALFSDSPISIGITSISRNGTIATITTNTTHNLIQGDTISIINSVSPFNVTYVLVRSILSTTSFTYIVENTGSLNTTSGTLQKFPNAFRTWNYYNFMQYLTNLETTNAKILPRMGDVYRNPNNYASDLIFSNTKYQWSGNNQAGWYLLKTNIADPVKPVLMDSSGNSSILMFDGTISYTDRTDKFLFGNDDHRSYKIWHGGGLYLANINTNNINGQNWLKLNPDLTQNNTANYISPRPNNLHPNGQALPVNLLLSGYTVWFDNDNQQLTWIYKDGTRQFSISYGSLGISNIWGFTTIAGGGTLSIQSGWYVLHDNVNKVIIGNRTNSSIGCCCFTLNFNNNTATVNSATRLNTTVYLTEENSFGDEISTYFNLSTNNVVALFHYSNSGQSLQYAITSNIFSGDINIVAITTATVPGTISQIGINPVYFIDTSGNIWFADWGHDDSGMFRLPPANDDGLGIVKIPNASIHTRLLTYI